MAEVKGTMVKAWMAFLREIYGDTLVNESIKSARGADSRLLKGPFLDSSWYPIDTSHALTRLTGWLTGGAQPHIALEVGRYMARHVYGSVYRNLIVDDPVKQVTKFAWTHDLFYRGLRTQRVETTGPASCIVTCVYEPGERLLPGTCDGFLGYWLQMLELTGAANVRGNHSRCTLEGEDRCEFIIAWGLPVSED